MEKKQRMVYDGVVGDKNWIWLRANIINSVLESNTERKFNKFINDLLQSLGTKEELIQKRKELKMKPFKKEELKKMKGGEINDGRS